MSATEHYKWVEGKAPPPLDAHSLAKHEVLEAYLFQYVRILAGRPGIPQFKLNLIDGFCGGGIYSDRSNKGKIHLGSPLIFLNAMKAVETAINLERTVPFSLNVRYYFVDKQKAFIEYLKNRIREHGYADAIEQGCCQCIVGNFADRLDEIIADIGARHHGKRSIFLLDQYGYIDAVLPLINKIFTNVEGAEVILTFAADKLIDFFNSSTQYTSLMNKLGINPSKADVSTVRGQQIWRYQMESWIAKELHANSGAKYFTRFFIISPHSHRAYWLLHFSNHLRAHDAMVGIHWQVQNHFAHYGTAGLNDYPILGFDPDRAGFQELTFDANARDLAHKALMEELPRLVHQFRDGIRVEEVRSRTANHTPTDMAINRAVINALRIEGEWTVKTEKGGERRSASGIRGGDIIVPNRQLRLFFSTGKTA